MIKDKGGDPPQRRWGRDLFYSTKITPMFTIDVSKLYMCHSPPIACPI